MKILKVKEVWDVKVSNYDLLCSGDSEHVLFLMSFLSSLSMDASNSERRSEGLESKLMTSFE